MRETLRSIFPALSAIQPPGTLEGGDICNADGHFFIGISRRTNPEGARQLADWLAPLGYTSSLVDVRGLPGLLHLKTGFSYAGGRRLVVVGPVAEGNTFDGFDVIRALPDEEPAANVLWINERVLITAGCPNLQRALRAAGCAPFPVDTSEFRKMDGSLTCLSLRF